MYYFGLGDDMVVVNKINVTQFASIPPWGNWWKLILAAASLTHSKTHVTLFYSHIMAVEEFEYAYAHLIDKSGNFLTLTEARNQRTSLSSELTRMHCK